MKTQTAIRTETLLAIGFAGALGVQSLALADVVQLESGPLSGHVQHGQKLFETETYGVANGKTCNTCHPKSGKAGSTLPDGRKVPSLNNGATLFPRFHPRFDKVFTLSDQIRHCVNEIKGTPPEYGSVNLGDLAAYVTSLSEGKPIDMGGHPQ